MSQRKTADPTFKVLDAIEQAIDKTSHNPIAFIAAAIIEDLGFEQVGWWVEGEMAGFYFDKPELDENDEPVAAQPVYVLKAVKA